MAKWLLITETNCADAAGEAQFNEWYNRVHIPDVLETPAIISATRYENIAPATGKGKFLTLYEIEADNIDDVMKMHIDNMARKKAQGRFSELVVLVSRGVYKQICRLPR